MRIVAWYTAAVDSSQEPMALYSSKLTSAGFNHAFFTRYGGISEPPFDSLNFSLATGDAPAAVQENMRRAGCVLGVPAEKIYLLNQVHGVQALQVHGDDPREEMLRRDGDIVFSADSSLACGTRTADCGPLLFADPRSGLVAAAHAGWRGTVAGVVVATVEAVARLGVRPEELIVAIGPMIERCCFEVGEEVAQTIAAAGAAGASVIDRSQAKPHVDLRAVLVAQLRTLEVTNIVHVAGCTQCRPDIFHSYRRDGKVGGRMLSAIVPRA
jgi:hypothetical protein